MLRLAGDSTFHPRAYPPVPAVKSGGGARLALKSVPDDWDLENQRRMKAMETSSPNIADLYEDFQEMRNTERAEMERRNRVDNHDTRRDLSDAIEFVGSCSEMCPVYERVRRTYQNNVKQYELDEHGKVSPQLAVKAFSRPAAGQPPALPSDVRPPHILQQTVEYLKTEIVPQLPASHPFLWDRTRSVRQDFTYQNYGGKEALWCNETIVRIHILCLHVMAKESDWSKQQELEQFNKALKTLDEQYQLRTTRKTLQQCPYEPEMRAYQLISQIFNAEIAFKIESLPSFIVQHPLVQLAFKLRSYIKSPSPLVGEYFRAVQDPNVPVLIKILCGIHYPQIRQLGLKQLRRSLHRKSARIPLQRLFMLLGFEYEQEMAEFCRQCKISVQDGWADLTSCDDEVRVDAWPAKLEVDFLVLDAAEMPEGIALHPRSSTQPSTRPSIPSFGQSFNKPAQQSPQPFGQAFGQSFGQPSGQSAPSLGEPLTPQPVVLPPKPSVSKEAIEALCAAELSNIVRQHCAQVAHQLIEERNRKQQRQKQLQDQLRTQARTQAASQLCTGILASIASTACHKAARNAILAERLRRRNCLRTVCGTIAKRAQWALARVSERKLSQNAAREYIQGLRSSRPRLSAGIGSASTTMNGANDTVSVDSQAYPPVSSIPSQFTPEPSTPKKLHFVPPSMPAQSTPVRTPSQSTPTQSSMDYSIDTSANVSLFIPQKRRLPAALPPRKRSTLEPNLTTATAATRPVEPAPFSELESLIQRSKQLLSK